MVGWYFDAMYTFDEQGGRIRDPLIFDRPELFEMVKSDIRLLRQRLLSSR